MYRIQYNFPVHHAALSQSHGQVYPNQSPNLLKYQKFRRYATSLLLPEIYAPVNVRALILHGTEPGQGLLLQEIVRLLGPSHPASFKHRRCWDFIPPPQVTLQGWPASSQSVQSEIKNQYVNS